jgi:hypothetical protein
MAHPGHNCLTRVLFRGLAHRIDYDPIRELLLLFGGDDGNTKCSGQTKPGNSRMVNGHLQAMKDLTLGYFTQWPLIHSAGLR